MNYFLIGDKVIVRNSFDQDQYGVVTNTWQKFCAGIQIEEYMYLPKYEIRLSNGDSTMRYDTDLKLQHGDASQIIMTTSTGYRFTGTIKGIRKIFNNGERLFDLENLALENSNEFSGGGPYSEILISRR